jgi:hypothetical protein
MLESDVYENLPRPLFSLFIVAGFFARVRAARRTWALFSRTVTSSADAAPSHHDRVMVTVLRGERCPGRAKANAATIVGGAKANAATSV